MVNCTEYIPLVTVLIGIKHVIGLNGIYIVRIPDNQYKIQASFWRKKRRENAANLTNNKGFLHNSSRGTDCGSKKGFPPSNQQLITRTLLILKNTDTFFSTSFSRINKITLSELKKYSLYQVSQ